MLHLFPQVPQQRYETSKGRIIRNFQSQKFRLNAPAAPGISDGRFAHSCRAKLVQTAWEQIRWAEFFLTLVLHSRGQQLLSPYDGR